MLAYAAEQPATASAQLSTVESQAKVAEPRRLATIARLSTLGSRKFRAKDPVLDSLCRLLGSVLRCPVSGAALPVQTLRCTGLARESRARLLKTLLVCGGAETVRISHACAVPV